MVVVIFMAVCVNKKQILYIHAKWLHDNGYYKEFKDCLNQAKTYDPYEDVRQIRWGKRKLKAQGRPSSAVLRSSVRYR